MCSSDLFGYFMFDVRKLDIVETLISHLLSNPYKAKKIYIFGNYSVVCAILEKLIENGLHLQVIMLDIEINIWDNVIISWELLSNFTKLKFLNVDDSNGIGSNKFIPDITAHLPAGLEALSIVNMLDYNEPFSPQIVESNLKVIKIGVMNKWNQPLMGLPTGLETLIIKSGEFNQRREEGKARLNLLANEIARLASVILTEYYGLPKKLQGLKAHPQAMNDMQQQLPSA